MNKEELLKKINALLDEVKQEKENAKDNLDRVYLAGKINGLLWAEAFILNMEELLK